MCKTHIPKYRCGHVGDTYEVCEEIECFHGECEGYRPTPIPVKQKPCCSEECCEAGIVKKQEEVRKLEDDIELFTAEDRHEILQIVREAVTKERKYHERICSSRPRENGQRFDAWTYRRESKYHVHKMRYR